ncbi:MAG: hypothetical protein LW836_08610 [Gemmatimonadetes bacterium]|nr:hypothetical protein [Gemmatimonadota bacterium]
MSSRTMMVREGILAGVLGATVIALWFLVLDSIRGAPLTTPLTLGRHLLRATGVGSADARDGLVLVTFSILHVGVFVAIGMICGKLLAMSERTPMVLIGVGLLFVAFEVLLAGFTEMLAMQREVLLPRLHVAGANLLAAVVMAGMLWRTHRSLPHRFLDALANDADDGASGSRDDIQPTPRVVSTAPPT